MDQGLGGTTPLLHGSVPLVQAPAGVMPAIPGPGGTARVQRVLQNPPPTPLPPSLPAPDVLLSLEGLARWRCYCRAAPACVLPGRFVMSRFEPELVRLLQLRAAVWAWIDERPTPPSGPAFLSFLDSYWADGDSCGTFGSGGR